MLRMIVVAVGMSILTFLAGCVMHESYGGPEVPGADLAVVKGYWRYMVLYDEELHIVSVDGSREDRKSGWPYAYSISLPSGRHWLQLAILRNSGLIARCAFEWTFEAGHHYKLQRVQHDQLLLAHPTSAHFPASISMVVTAPSQPTQQLSAPTVCGNGPFCRRDSDCPKQSCCQFDEGFQFGICGPRER